MLITDDLSPERLSGLGGAFATWRKSGYEPPLVILRSEWARATDVFPIEITDMRCGYEVLRGPDPVASLRVAPADLRAAHEDLRIVVLANELSLPDMARLLRAGADGYLVNELSAEAFSLSLLLVMKGEKVLPSTLASMLASDCHSGNGALIKAQKNLTEREKQILQCLLNAYSNKHIARALNISEGTVKVHLKSLMKKISAGNRTQAALWARNNGIDSGHIMAG